MLDDLHDPAVTEEEYRARAEALAGELVALKAMRRALQRNRSRPDNGDLPAGHQE